MINMVIDKLASWWIRQKLGVVRKRIQKDIKTNELKARQKLITSIEPMLDIFEIEEDYYDDHGYERVATTQEIKNGTAKKRLVTVADLHRLETEQLATLMEALVTELQKKV